MTRKPTPRLEFALDLSGKNKVTIHSQEIPA